MEQPVETGKDKVKKICEVLRKETLEPAVEEAERIITKAKAEADSILNQARSKAEAIKAEAEADIVKRQGIFNASLKQGARQSVEWLKQEIEGRLFKKNLGGLIAKATCDVNLLSEMVRALMTAVESEGLSVDLSAIVPSAVKVEEVNALLGKEILAQLKEKSVIVGPQKGGVKLKLQGDKATVDLSDAALLELMTRYVRKDFHRFFFAE